MDFICRPFMMILRMSSPEKESKETVEMEPKMRRWDVHEYEQTVQKSHPVFFAIIAVGIIIFSIKNLSCSTTPLLYLLILSPSLYLYVDILSGTIHIILDNPYLLNWPIFGKMCAVFQQHHVSPSFAGEMDLFTNLRSQAQPFIYHYVAALALGLDVRDPAHSAYFICLGCTLLWMNMAHRWAHMPKNKRGNFVLACQSIGISLPPEVHHRHHRDITVGFCLLNGSMDPVLDTMLKIPGLHPESLAWLPVIGALAVTSVMYFPICAKYFVEK